MCALQKAICASGSQEKLAGFIGVSQQRVSYWLKTGKVPAEFVVAIESATKVSRHDLRPDIFPRLSVSPSELEEETTEVGEML